MRVCKREEAEEWADGEGGRRPGKELAKYILTPVTFPFLNRAEAGLRLTAAVSAGPRTLEGEQQDVADLMVPGKGDRRVAPTPLAGPRRASAELAQPVLLRIEVVGNPGNGGGGAWGANGRKPGLHLLHDLQHSLGQV